MNTELQKIYLPTSIFMGGHQENLPLLENKLIEDQSTIYVCQDKVCKLPVTLTSDALEQLKAAY